MIIISVLMFMLALAGLFLFEVKTLFGILMIACAVCVLTARFVLKNRRIGMIATCVLAAAFLALAIVPESKMGGNAKEADEDEKDSGKKKNKDDESGEKYFKAARKHIDKEEFQEAEQELSEVPEGLKRTEEYYILSSDITIAKNGFDGSVSREFLTFFENAVRDCPDSLILNYRTGIVAYALKQYITAENYLSRAYELAPEKDPYVPYALAAVYKEQGENEYAYAFMTIAEKNGMLDSGECDGEELADWYKEYKKNINEREAAK